MDSISSGYVTAYGPGLMNGVSGEPSLFTISTKGAGAGGLSMAVEGPSKAEVCIFRYTSKTNQKNSSFCHLRLKLYVALKTK